MGQKKPFKVFISYDREDEEFMSQLERHLAFLRREQQIEFSDSYATEAGEDVAKDIRSHLEESKLILLLISSDFIASESCYEFEMKQAMACHKAGTAKVIPIILRACIWQDLPFGELQVLPKDKKPIKESTNPDKVFKEIAEEISQVINIAQGNTERGHQFLESRPIPELLAFLPNRDEQVDQVETTLQKLLCLSPPRPVVYITHGDEAQSHDRFLDCLKDFYLPNSLKEEFSPITEYALWWPTKLRNLSEIDNRLRKYLAEVVLQDGFASKEKVNERLAAHPGSVLVHTTLNTESWEKYGFQLVEAFLNFWQQWPLLRSRQKLIICLLIKYQVKKDSKWLKRYRFRSLNLKVERKLEEFSEKGAQSYDRLITTVLPKLTNVKQLEVEGWAYKEVTRRFLGEQGPANLISEIRSLFEDWEKRTSASDIPMDDLAKLLENLLKARSVGDFL